jgi:hypothetical protein
MGWTGPTDEDAEREKAGKEKITPRDNRLGLMMMMMMMSTVYLYQLQPSTLKNLHMFLYRPAKTAYLIRAKTHQ